MILFATSTRYFNHAAGLQEAVAALSSDEQVVSVSTIEELGAKLRATRTLTALIVDWPAFFDKLSDHAISLGNLATDRSVIILFNVDQAPRAPTEHERYALTHNGLPSTKEFLTMLRDRAPELFGTSLRLDPQTRTRFGDSNRRPLVASSLIEFLVKEVGSTKIHRSPLQMQQYFVSNEQRPIEALAQSQFSRTSMAVARKELERLVYEGDNPTGTHANVERIGAMLKCYADQETYRNVKGKAQKDQYGLVVLGERGAGKTTTATYALLKSTESEQSKKIKVLIVDFIEYEAPIIRITRDRITSLLADMRLPIWSHETYYQLAKSYLDGRRDTIGFETPSRAQVSRIWFDMNLDEKMSFYCYATSEDYHLLRERRLDDDNVVRKELEKWFGASTDDTIRVLCLMACWLAEFEEDVVERSLVQQIAIQLRDIARDDMAFASHVIEAARKEGLAFKVPVDVGPDAAIVDEWFDALVNDAQAADWLERHGRANYRKFCRMLGALSKLHSFVLFCDNIDQYDSADSETAITKRCMAFSRTVWPDRGFTIISMRISTHERNLHFFRREESFNGWERIIIRPVSVAYAARRRLERLVRAGYATGEADWNRVYYFLAWLRYMTELTDANAKTDIMQVICARHPYDLRSQLKWVAAMMKSPTLMEGIDKFRISDPNIYFEGYTTLFYLRALLLGHESLYRDELTAFAINVYNNGDRMSPYNQLIRAYMLLWARKQTSFTERQIVEAFVGIGCPEDVTVAAFRALVSGDIIRESLTTHNPGPDRPREDFAFAVTAWGAYFEENVMCSLAYSQATWWDSAKPPKFTDEAEPHFMSVSDIDGFSDKFIAWLSYEEACLAKLVDVAQLRLQRNMIVNRAMFTLTDEVGRVHARLRIRES